jgi:hypothetical protein
MQNKIFKNSTVYYREQHNAKHPYTVLTNQIIEDDRLNATEKGLMYMILSNSDEYVFNSDYLQKISGLGKVTYFNAIKHLQEFGYLIKRAVSTGGYRWTILESKNIFNAFLKASIISYSNTKNSWVIDEKLESSLQEADFQRILGFQNLENQNAEIQIAEFQNLENRNAEIQTVISTNSLSPKEKINKEIIIKEKTNNEIVYGDTVEIFDFEEMSLTDTSKSEVKPSDYLPPQSIQNDLQLILNSVPKFEMIYKNGHFEQYDISNYENSYIAYQVFLYNSSNSLTKEQTWNDMKLKEPNFLLFYYLIKYSKEVPDSQIWKCYEAECQQADRLDLLKD